MKTCFLMRHGMTDMAGRFCGHSDPRLNDAGRAQIESAVSTLPSAPEVVFTSDLLRARESAAILAAHFSVPILVRPGLREICFGEWEGLSWHEIEDRFPAESGSWLRQFPAGVIPSGERYEGFVERVKGEMEFLAARAQSQVLVAVTHGGFIRSILIEMCGLPSDEAFHLSSKYGAVVELSCAHMGTREPDLSRISLYDDASEREETRV